MPDELQYAEPDEMPKEDSEPAKKKRGRKPKAEAEPVEVAAPKVVKDVKQAIEAIIADVEAANQAHNCYDLQRAVLSLQGAINLIGKSKAKL